MGSPVARWSSTGTFITVPRFDFCNGGRLEQPRFSPRRLILHACGFVVSSFTFAAVGWLICPVDSRVRISDDDRIPSSNQTMKTRSSHLGDCPLCGSEILSRDVLIEYDRDDGRGIWAECPDCTRVVDPR